MPQKLINWYLSCQAIPYWYVLLTDCCIVLFSGMVGYTINHGLPPSTSALGNLFIAVCAYLPCYVVGFRLFHTYSGIIRQSSFEDLVRISYSLIVGIVLVMILRFYFHTDLFVIPFRFRDLVLQTLLAIVLMCGLRITAKIFYDIYLRRSNRNGVYGLSGNALLDREMKYLLPREPIKVDMEAISKELQGKCVLVTGAAGSIGSELAWLLASCKPGRLVLVDQAETPLHDVRIKMRREWPEVECETIVTSICHSHRMERIFTAFRPEIIFHAAAYKHVPMMEDNPVESVLNNVDGTRKLADLAVRFHVKKFVMISTDKAVNPTNVMGCSKRICEIYCQSLAKSNTTGCQFITTRFGNVLGSNGSVIPIFREQIRRGGPVTVTHPDITRYFMLIPEACRLVLEAATIGHGGEIFAFDMGEQVRIVDLARRMIELSGRRDIKIEFSGLRPGEKLYEEVLDEGEKVLPTSNPKIKIAKVREYDFNEARHQIDNLIDTALTYDATNTVRMMKRIVPEYESKYLSQLNGDLCQENQEIHASCCCSVS